MMFFAAVVAMSVGFVLTVVLLVREIRALEQRHDALLHYTKRLALASRRTDDRLTYYEHRSDGLKGLRAAYDKRLAQLAQKRAEAEASDAAPEGTAQAERLVG